LPAKKKKTTSSHHITIRQIAIPSPLPFFQATYKVAIEGTQEKAGNPLNHLHYRYTPAAERGPICRSSATHHHLQRAHHATRALYLTLRVKQNGTTNARILSRSLSLRRQRRSSTQRGQRNLYDHLYGCFRSRRSGSGSPSFRMDNEMKPSWKPWEMAGTFSSKSNY
jgi:hypothetical protein